MSINKKITEKEYKSRIDIVVDYILKNLNKDISLQALSGVANYSPYHLQKVFKQVIGITPKQYIIKLKIETSLHLIVIHSHKTIIELSAICGFSSPSVFSRAFKNYFGISPEKIGVLTKRDKIETLKGLYLNTSMNNSIQIQQSFKDLIQLLKTHDIFNVDSKCLGILSPHQGNIYKTFVSVNPNQNVPSKCKGKEIEIKGGKFAVFKVQGDMQETMKAAQYFHHQWLPESGYKIADTVIGYETFFGDPATMSYNKIERELLIPIEPF